MSVVRTTPVPPDVDIAQSADIKPISEIASRYNLEKNISSTMEPTRQRFG